MHPSRFVLAALAAFIGLNCGGVHIVKPLEVFPSDGATDVPLHSTISVRFPRKAEGILPHNALAVRDELGVVIGGELEASGDLIRFMPAKPLEPNHHYTVELEDGVTLAEGRLGQGVKWAFHTEVDPAIAEVVPAQDASEVALEQTVTVAFNRSVGTFAVSDDEVLTVEGVEGTVTREANSLVFTPSTPFRIAAEYVASIKGTMTDDRGDTFEFDYSWKFRTRDGTISVGPPADGKETRVYGSAQMVAVGSGTLVAWMTEESPPSLVVRVIDADGRAGTPVTLSTSEWIQNFSVDANVNGDWIVAWHERNSGASSMWASRYDANTHELLGPTEYRFNEGNACYSCMRAKISDDGSFVVYWQQTIPTSVNGSTTYAYDVVYTVGGAPKRVLGSSICRTNMEYEGFDLEFDSNQKLHAALACSSSSWVQVWHLAQSGVAPEPTVLSTSGSSRPRFVRSGDILSLFWREADVSWWAALNSDGGWQDTQVVGAQLRSVDSNAAGEIAAVFVEHPLRTDWSKREYVLRRFAPTHGWLPREVLLVSSPSTDASLLGLAVDGDGNVSLLFNGVYGDEMGVTLWRSREPGVAWTIRELWDIGSTQMSVNTQNELTLVRTTWAPSGSTRQLDYFRFD